MTKLKMNIPKINRNARKKDLVKQIDGLIRIIEMANTNITALQMMIEETESEMYPAL